MEFKEKTNHYKKKIDKRLKSFLKKRIRKVNNINPTVTEMMEHILEYNIRGGKRIRPILVIIGYLSCGGKDEKAIIDAAIAVELMQSFLLVHDDIMDQDELRRGYLTLHKVYEKKCKVGKNRTVEDAKRYGESMALIAGDILAMLGSEALLETNFPMKNKLKAIDKFNRTVINTCFGQALDVKSGFEQKINEADVKKMYELKTAVYTFEAPLQIGATLAGASETQQKAISKFAMHLGKAFQFQDDILGIFGSRQKLGKPIGSDIKEGKRTLLILKALEKANPKDKKIILNALGNQDIGLKEVNEVRKIIKASGSLEYSKNVSEKYSQKAKKEIEKSKIKIEGKEFLLDLAEYVIRREY